ncbi:MAG: glycogen/starch synthase [Candidatus Woesearchaeota archaeon]
MLFEVSWEVCNKVGGIHTVLATKAPVIKKHIKDHIYVGPWLFDNQKNFIEKPATKKLAGIFEDLQKQGVYCRYGTWNIDAKPKVILVEFTGLIHKKDAIKTELWDLYNIDSLFSRWEFEEPILWSTAVGMLVDAYDKTTRSKTIAHFHEWMAGAAILHLKKVKSKVKTVFTTHATMLGRTISGHHRDLYKELDTIDADSLAKEYCIQDKHLTEKACALNADVFTTVSEITGKECSAFYGKNPDAFVYNGISSISVKNTGKLRSLIEKIFPGYKNAPLFFNSGRYEFHDKGMDYFIDALAEIKDEKAVALFLVPAQNYGPKKELEQGAENLHVTHYLFDEDNDAIVWNLKNKGLDNNCNLKTLFIPIYIAEDDDFFNESYYTVISECNLGVFPSIYEPWGYTPLECSEMGIPAVTTTNAGYGLYMKQFLQQKGTDGVFVLNMETVVPELVSVLKQFSNAESHEANKISAKGLAQHAQWSVLVENYLKIYEQLQK